jgi:nitrous oxidase accessory protein NosD
MNLIIEIERVIKLLDVKIENALRIMATMQLKQIYNSNNINSLHKPQLYILNKLKQKIVTGNAMIAQIDKGKTTVIIYKEEYAEKIHTFLTDNEIPTLQKNPIKKDQKRI